jgi:hypothetical protein
MPCKATFNSTGETTPPYEQCRVMHSVGPSSLVKAGSGTERCT